MALGIRALVIMALGIITLGKTALGIIQLDKSPGTFCVFCKEGNRTSMSVKKTFKVSSAFLMVVEV